MNDVAIRVVSFDLKNDGYEGQREEPESERNEPGFFEASEVPQFPPPSIEALLNTSSD